MGLFDTLLGRTKPVRANLDALFSLPSAAITLQVTAGLMPTGRAGVCFKPPAGQPFAEMQAELEQLLATPDDPAALPSATAPLRRTSARCPTAAGGAGHTRRCAMSATSSATGGSSSRRPRSTTSSHACTWCTPRSRTRAGARSCCARSSASPPGPPRDPDADRRGGRPRGERVERASPSPGPLYLVYLAKQGTFYPFAPTGHEQRDNELELRLKGMLADDLPIEPDLSRWFPMWDLPIA